MITLSDEEAAQRLGPIVTTPVAKYPARITISGQYIDLVPLSPEHADALFPVVAQPEHERLWDYMLNPPFQGDALLFSSFIAARSANENNMVFWAIIDKAPPTLNSPKALGMISYLHISEIHRTIEIGNVMFSTLLQRSRKSSEAIYLLLKQAFEDLGYRRVEWKCNNLNTPSKRAAVRYGFTYEGLFKKHYVIKGRSRDTAWFAMVDDDWPQRKQALGGWLSQDNFDEQGGQKMSLKEAHQKAGYTVPETVSAPPLQL